MNGAWDSKGACTESERCAPQYMQFRRLQHSLNRGLVARTCLAAWREPWEATGAGRGRGTVGPGLLEDWAWAKLRARLAVLRRRVSASSPSESLSDSSLLTPSNLSRHLPSAPPFICFSASEAAQRGFVLVRGVPLCLETLTEPSQQVTTSSRSGWLANIVFLGLAFQGHRLEWECGWEGLQGWMMMCSIFGSQLCF